MSPVSPSEVRIVDDQVEALKQYAEHQNSRAVLHVIRVVRLIWELVKREHGWR